MARRDYYEVLGVDRNADEAEIKRAYRNLAMRYHPDRNQEPEAVEKMKEINEAYAVLSDTEKRRLYDAYGHAGLGEYTQADIYRNVDFSSLFREFGLGDLFGFGGGPFESFFGGRTTARRAARKGADLRYDLTVTLQEAAFGVEKTIELPRSERCATCGGSGAAAGGAVACDTCQGTGRIVRAHQTGAGYFQHISACHKCHGAGKLIKEHCPECKGRGFTERTKAIAVKIPPGADSGYAVRVKGEGEKGETIPGDLYVVVNVAKHPVFERHGDDIYVQQDVNFTVAALGGEVEIPALDGSTVKLEIPEGTQTGAVFRINGKGIPHLDGRGRGDEYTLVKVVTPTNLSRREQELLREFERLRQEAREEKDKN